jgi:pimeloyl-ACP methyl ester carboxylesterase
MRVREYGESGPLVLVLHGGPAAPGEMAPVARGLSDKFRVLEPFQRGSGATPLTVARHIADLHELIASRLEESPPAVVGFSWGAMLALAHAAAHPADAGCLVLVGCGTFDETARGRLRATVESRTSDALRARLDRLAAEYADPDDLLRAQHTATLPVYSHDLLGSDTEAEALDARAHRQTWDDMLRLQREGVYPAAFASLRLPVLMIHGAEDPHPGHMVYESLTPYVPTIEYVEIERCGHYPWLEHAAKGTFFSILRAWLGRHAVSESPPSVH